MTAQHLLWQPDKTFIEGSHLRQYQNWLHQHYQLTFSDYPSLWQWSVDHIDTFWESVWKYFNIIEHSPYQKVLSSHQMPGAVWFEGASLNYAEHIFRKQTQDKPALYFASETQSPSALSWDALHQQVAAVRQYLIELGVKKGDCIAAYLPNIPEAIVAFLATNSLGAIWTCCSPDFGPNTVKDRFEQVQPKVLFAINEYHYNGKTIPRKAEVEEIARQIQSIGHTIHIPNTGETSLSPITRAKNSLWSDVIQQKTPPLAFEPVSFDHPVWVLYSSGTTGKPKAITHSNGGVLLEHLKYLHFHNDVKAGEHFFWFTTTGWMMWNFLQASMLAGGIPVLYDGSPAYPNLDKLWQLAESLPIHHFGTSAPYLTACMKKKMSPGKTHNLGALRSIGSTGAPLPPEVFEWVYDDIHPNIWLCSMSGGTDVCTAFVGGCPGMPVYKGAIQGRALGCALYAYNEEGSPITGSLGEMVIEKPMPSMPVFFWGDPQNERYKESYFQSYPGKWCHGDWIEIYNNGSLKIQGRSDATLNRKGIRIGTAEIYAVLDRLDGLADSLVVDLEKPNGDDQMILFAVFSTDDHENTTAVLKKALREQCSPRHVPDHVVAVEDIPYTLSGKKMEIPVKKALMGMDISKSVNPDAVRNPSALQFFQKFDVKKL